MHVSLLSVLLCMVAHLPQHVCLVCSVFLHSALPGDFTSAVCAASSWNKNPACTEGRNESHIFRSLCALYIHLSPTVPHLDKSDAHLPKMCCQKHSLGHLKPAAEQAHASALHNWKLLEAETRHEVCVWLLEQGEGWAVAINSSQTNWKWKNCICHYNHHVIPRCEEDAVRTICAAW